MDFCSAPQPVYNPPIPYTGPIPGGLQDGKMIMIKGRVLPHSDRFHVNLQCGLMAHDCDVAFHFNPRFECPDYVVCNTFENRSWCSEERKNEMPIQKGTTFQLLILVQNDSYKVAVNDQHFLEFKHRIPISRVDTISIAGQVEVVSLSFINNHFQPAAPAGNTNNFNPSIPGFPSSAYPVGDACPAGSMFASAAPASLAGSMFAPPAITNPPIPYTGPIPGGLQDGKMIMIKGRVLPHCDRFYVNLQCGLMAHDCDVAFHFNPRFECPDYVVCNTFENRSWCSEERKNEMPIQKGATFQLLILVQNDSYKVAVNDQHFLEFKHRIPISRVDTISIAGQVEVVSLSFTNNHFQPAAPAGNINNFNPSFPGFPSSAFPIGNACPAGSMFASAAPASLAGSMFAQPAFANPASSLFPEPAFPSGMIAPQVPYKAPIPGGLFLSRSVVIQGTVEPNPDSFFINLKPSNSTDIAFHISPRFSSENAVVRNSCFQSSWGTEERSLAENPFSPGQLFEIAILCEALCFRVSVNGRHVFDFNHRYQPVQQINELQIEGDVTLSSVRT